MTANNAAKARLLGSGDGENLLVSDHLTIWSEVEGQSPLWSGGCYAQKLTASYSQLFSTSSWVKDANRVQTFCIYGSELGGTAVRRPAKWASPF